MERNRNIRFSLFPGGFQRALIMSYDDGRESDRRLVEIFNENGIRGTFHLNSGEMGKPGYISKQEASSLYAKHEIAVHTASHAFLTQCPLPVQLAEIQEDRQALESISNYPVTGMSWPYGAFNQQCAAVAEACGIEYSRTVIDTGKFEIPADFMQWNPTTHHSGNLDELWNCFMDNHREERKLFFVWGHSYEFDNKKNWGKIEDFCKMAGSTENIWFATAIEVKRYIDALHRLVFSNNMRIIHNISAADVWVSIDREALCIKSGKIINL